MSSLIFDSSAKGFVLEAFNKTTDPEGYIVERENPSSRVVVKDGTNIKIDRFGGIRKGSEVYIKSDIISLIELCDDLKSK
jgi:hypothetical protein